MPTKEFWKDGLNEAAEVIHRFVDDGNLLGLCEEFSQLLIRTYQQGAKVLSCGNGGSHCDAMHFAEELTGRYRKDRRPLGALALGDASHVTCVANDYGFKFIFSRQVEALGQRGDVLLLLSTSGNSENLIEAASAARKKGLTTVALLGKGGGKLKSLVDLAIVVPAETSDRVQEVHIKLIHLVIESVERVLFPENYL